MADAIITGAGGAINGVACVRYWKVIAEAMPGEGVCSASDSGYVRIAGNDDWRGVYTAYGVEPDYLPGELFRFIGATRDGKGVDSQAEGAIVDRIVLKWDTEKAKLLSYECYFSAADHELLLGAYSAEDLTVAAPPTPVSLGMSLDDSPVDHVRNMELVLECSNPHYVTSDTDGHTHRKRGNYDASFKASVYLDDPGILPDKNEIKEVKFATKLDDEGEMEEWWHLKWAIITEATPILDIEGGEDGRGRLMEAAIAGDMTGFKGGIKGFIKSPGLTEWWPPA